MTRGFQAQTVPKTVPAGVDAAVASLFMEMIRQQASYQQVADRAGVSANTIWKWRRQAEPSITNVRAALNALELDVSVSKRRGVSHGKA